MISEIHLIDAFTDRAFSGNPAAVCITDMPRDEAWMQKMAAEMGCPETAFLNHTGAGWRLRWFTPVTEVNLCGHATLAAASVLWSARHVSPEETISFLTRSGRLHARLRGAWIKLDFPADPESPAECPVELRRALGRDFLYTGKNSSDYLVELPSAGDVRSLRPDFALLAQVPCRGIIVTAAADQPEYDFVSRFFAPGLGIPEDPVTGSAHCCLGPYWAKKLGKADLTGFQCSARGGTVRVSPAGDRVVLAGKVVPVFSGKLLV
jgi:PhzF family phenazine biosynthesis protein